MTISLKADPGGTFGEILINGSPALKVSAAALELADGKDFFTQGNILGVVSQSGGVPTGAVIERGSNANGEYVRFADGTQICIFVGTPNNSNTASGSLFTSSGSVTWTFPATFSVAPNCYGAVGNTLRWVTFGEPATGSAISRHYSTVSDTTQQNTRMTAIGRWF